MFSYFAGVNVDLDLDTYGFPKMFLSFCGDPIYVYIYAYIYKAQSKDHSALGSILGSPYSMETDTCPSGLNLVRCSACHLKPLRTVAAKKASS